MECRNERPMEVDIRVIQMREVHAINHKARGDKAYQALWPRRDASGRIGGTKPITAQRKTVLGCKEVATGAEQLLGPA